jgi:YVTN family beta-propeller protein
VKVFLAGRVAVETDGVVVDEFPGRQVRLLFAYLVAEQGRPVPRDELADALWGASPPASWEKALSVVISRLRALLSEATGDGANHLTAAFGCYRLALPEGTWIDLFAAADATHTAEQALAEGEIGDARAAAALAVSLTREPFLPGEDRLWVDQKRRELTAVRARALSALADACLRSGELREAVTRAEEAVALEPFRESGYRSLMEAHAAAGNRAEALRVYDRCRRLLSEELGAYPSPETDSIYRRLLEAPAVATPASAPAAAPRPTVAPAGAMPRTGRRRRVAVFAGAALAVAAVVAGAVALRERGASDTAVAGPSGNAITILRPRDGRLTAAIPIDAPPGPAAVGFRSLWVLSPDSNAVLRIDPARHIVIQRIEVGHGPAGIAVGGRDVWVTNSLDGTVSRIDPRTDTVVQRIRVGNGPAGIAAGEGHVWVANGDDGTVTPIDPRTGIPGRALPVSQSADGVAVGDGSVWVTSAAQGTVVMINARTREVVAQAQVGAGADAVAFGAGGVWVANPLLNTVTRIDPVSDTVADAIHVGDGPDGIAVVNGTVWVTNELAGTLTKIDAARNEPVTTTEIGERPQGVVNVFDALYVPTRGAASHRGGTLTLLTSSGDLQDLDPAVAYSQTEWPIVTLVYDGLVGFRRAGGSAGLQPEPDLAVSLPTPTNGGRTYTFQVRRGIRYSTGAVVRPADFRGAIERALQRPRGAGFYFTGIIGAQRCFAFATARHAKKARLARSRPCQLSRGITTDPAANTVTFHLTAPDPDFLFKLGMPAAFAVPAGTPVHPRGFVPGTGPYRIASFDPKRRLRLVRNPLFHEWSAAAQPAGFPDEIVERATGTANAHIVAALDGSADVASIGQNAGRPSPGMLTVLRTRHASQLWVTPFKITWYLALNTRLPPFNRVAARRALNLAIDRSRLRDLTVGRGLGQVTCQILPPNFTGYHRYCPYTAEPSVRGDWTAPDLERARQLVRASGTAGENVTVWLPDWTKFGRAAGAYVASVLDSLGYRARYRISKGLSAEHHEDRLHLQAVFSGWFADFAAPGGFINPLLMCKAYYRDNAFNNNLAEFCDPAIDREIGRAGALPITDPAATSRAWARIDRDLTDRAPWVAFANGVEFDVLAPRVGNYQINPTWGMLLDQLWVR